MNIKRLFIVTIMSLSLCPITPIAWATTPQDIEAYNNQIDADYEKIVQAINEANEKIKAYNQAEENRVKQEEEYNRQAQEQANLKNVEIDQINASEKARVEEENQKREEQYAQDMIQYEKEYSQYQEDLAVEEKIKAAGYESVEQYNDMINTKYNEPADLSVEKNTIAQEISVDQTYEIVQGTPSGRKIPVHIEHVFTDISMTYSTDFEIDANDTIILKGIGALVETVQPDSCLFYYNTDSDHLMGYWMNTYSELLNYPTATVSDGWDCGDTHTITYANSANDYYWDFEDISITYEYAWQPLRKYKTYNVPVEPVEPILELEEYVSIPYVAPAFIEVVPANIQPLLTIPTKAEYLKYKFDPITAPITVSTVITTPITVSMGDIKAQATSSLGNIEYPKHEFNSTATPNINPIITSTPTTAVPGSFLQANKSENITKTIQEVKPQDENISSPYQENEKVKSETIKDDTTSLAGPKTTGQWALINLIAMILTILPLIKLAHKDDKHDNEENKKYRYKDHNNIFGVIFALGSVLLFIFTENISLPMGFVDVWTLPMILICIGSIIIRILTRTTKEEVNEDNS